MVPQQSASAALKNDSAMLGDVDDGRQTMQKVFLDAKLATITDFDQFWPKPNLRDAPRQPEPGNLVDLAIVLVGIVIIIYPTVDDVEAVTLGMVARRPDPVDGGRRAAGGGAREAPPPGRPSRRAAGGSTSRSPRRPRRRPHPVRAGGRDPSDRQRIDVIERVTSTR